jgi:hypothetical protein
MVPIVFYRLIVILVSIVAISISSIGEVKAEQDSPMITVLPGCPVVVADVETMAAPPTPVGVRQFYITAMLGGTSKSLAAYSGIISYVVYDASGPKPFMGSTDVVPMFMNINSFMRFNIGEFAENYRHHIVGTPIVALSMSCTMVPNSLFTWQNKKLGGA